jgi:succinylglutamic semialdehyde dehydrogenase
MSRKLTDMNPATGAIFWEGQFSDAAQINQVFTQAKAALREWSQIGLNARVDFIKTFQELLIEDQDAMAELISRSTGKPLWESAQEVAAMAAKCDISIESFIDRCHPKQFNSASYQHSTRFRPHGIMGVLGPYNFPGHIPNGHIVPALLAGNVVIFKSSEFTPSVGAAIADLWQKAGLPDHVFQIIQGDAEQGKLICSHPELNGLCFTGSSTVGKQISAQLSENTGTILALEMGGNNALVIHDIKDVQTAAFIAVQSAFLSAGQRCTCARRLILTPDAPTGVLDLICQIASELRIGSYTDSPAPYMGPLIHSAAVEQALRRYEALLAHGAKPLLEMSAIDGPGSFVRPGIVKMPAQEIGDEHECFAPFLQVYHADSLSQAIGICNDSHFGLSASLLCQSKADYELFFQSVKAGVINWNAPIVPFLWLPPLRVNLKCQKNCLQGFQN